MAVVEYIQSPAPQPPSSSPAPPAVAETLLLELAQPFAMAELLRIVASRAAAFARRNPGNVRDGLRHLYRHLTGEPAPPAGNPDQVRRLGLVNPQAGNDLVVADGSGVRRWLRWLGILGGGLLGLGALAWLIRRDGGQPVEIDNAGGGGGGNGGLDPGMLLLVGVNMMGGGGAAAAGGDGDGADAGATTSGGDGDGADAATTTSGGDNDGRP